MKKVIFISSTGGHLEELFQLVPLFDKVNYFIITEKTKSNINLKKKYPKKVGFLMYGTRVKPIRYGLKYVFNCLKSFYYYIKIRPEYIITTGAHTAMPLCFISHFLGSKVIFIETLANRTTMSNSGKVIYKHHIADLFIVQWEELLDLYPDAIYGGALF